MTAQPDEITLLLTKFLDLHLASQLADDCISYGPLMKAVSALHNTVSHSGDEIHHSRGDLSSRSPESVRDIVREATEVLKRIADDIERTAESFVRRVGALSPRSGNGIVAVNQKAQQRVAVSTSESNDEMGTILAMFSTVNYVLSVDLLKRVDIACGVQLSDPYIRKLRDSLLFKHVPLHNLQSALRSNLSHSPLAPELAKVILNPHLQPFIPPQALLPGNDFQFTASGTFQQGTAGALVEILTSRGCVISDFRLNRLGRHLTAAIVSTLEDVSVVPLLVSAATEAGATGIELALFTVSYHAIPVTPHTATILQEGGLNSQFLLDWMAFLRSKNISVDRLKRLRPAGSRCDEFHLSVPSTLDLKALRKDIYTISKSHRVDVALQPSSVFRRQRRVAVFDMDSTLIRQEVIDEIARKTGVVDQVAKITEAAMNGEIDFKESLRRRVALLKGTSATVFEEVRKELVFTDGAKELCACLKRLGFRTAVISGGFVPLAKYVKYYLGLDYAFANTLAVSEDGKVLTGEVVGDIVDAERKAQLLEVISQAEEVTLDQVIAVGDGANDLPMLGKAGLGIAFNAKPRVQEQAATRINQPNLLNVLYLLGYSDEEVNQLIQSVKRYD